VALDTRRAIGKAAGPASLAMVLSSLRVVGFRPKEGAQRKHKQRH